MALDLILHVAESRDNGQKARVGESKGLELSAEELARAIKKEALRLGFAAVGITSLSALRRREQEFIFWRDSGYAGGLHYMQMFLERQAKVLQSYPGLKSIVVVAYPYAQSHPSESTVSLGAGRTVFGRIARYAHGRDYHRILMKKLRALGDWIRQKVAHPLQILPSVDKGPFPERAIAEAAGLGFFGKNTCIIRPRGGSFFFLGLLLTDLELPEDRPIRWDCGACQLCIQACPTQALVGPYQLDARRCIAYLTIEHRGFIPESLRDKMGDWLFGCDICQEVCPYNRRLDHASSFETSDGVGPYMELKSILMIRTEEEFTKRFAGTALVRAKREGLLRNACIVAGNLGNPALIPILRELAEGDPSPLVREHAIWAIHRILGGAGPMKQKSQV
jgi:epoxyqueuosine reductase